jgi:hypothetical protein
LVAPHRLSGCGGRFCAPRCHRISTQITPTNAAALIRNDAPIPGTFPASGSTPITISIPSTGPTARATLSATELSATASDSSLGGTSSGITYWNAGPASAAPIPSRNVNPSSACGVAHPASVVIPSSAEITSIHALVMISRFRRSYKSANTPAEIERRQIGSVPAVWMSDTQNAASACPSFSARINHGPPASRAHVPIRLTRYATQSARNVGTASGLQAPQFRALGVS